MHGNIIGEMGYEDERFVVKEITEVGIYQGMFSVEDSEGYVISTATVPALAMADAVEELDYLADVVDDFICESVHGTDCQDLEVHLAEREVGLVVAAYEALGLTRPEADDDEDDEEA